MARSLWRSAIRIGFHLLYNELAWTYDAVSWIVSLGEWGKWQRLALAETRGNRVLEVGHGPGHVLAALESAGYTAFGLDISPAMGKLASGRSAAPLVRARVQELPFRSAAFDTIISTFPTDYIVDPDTLSSLYRALSPAGVLVVVPEGHLTGSGLHHRFIEWLFRITGQREEAFGPEAGGRDPNMDPWKLLFGLMGTAGFQARRVRHQMGKSAATVIIATKAAG